MGGVQTLPGDLRTQRLENAIRGRLERLPAAVMGQQAGAEVVQRQDVVSPRLLRQVGLVRGQLQGVLPQQAELQLLQRLGVGQSEHLLEQKNAQDRRHRLVGTTVVVAIQGRELFFVDQRQGVRAKALGPGRLQAPLLGRRHQVAALEQVALRILRTKHQPHPLERKCVTDWYTPIYQESLIIRAVKGGFLRENQDCFPPRKVPSPRSAPRRRQLPFSGPVRGGRGIIGCGCAAIRPGEAAPAAAGSACVARRPALPAPERRRAGASQRPRWTARRRCRSVGVATR